MVIFELNHRAGSGIAFDLFGSKSPQSAQFWPQSRHNCLFGDFFGIFAYFGHYSIVKAVSWPAVWPIWVPKALRSHLWPFLENPKIWVSELDSRGNPPEK